MDQSKENKGFDLLDKRFPNYEMKGRIFNPVMKNPEMGPSRHELINLYRISKYDLHQRIWSTEKLLSNDGSLNPAAQLQECSF